MKIEEPPRAQEALPETHESARADTEARDVSLEESLDRLSQLSDTIEHELADVGPASAALPADGQPAVAAPFGAMETTSTRARWKTYLLMMAMQSRWLTTLLTRVGRNGPDALATPDPNRGDAKRWEYLENLSELARYAVIVGYIRRMKPHATVLDVGASNGVLAEELKHDVRRIRGIEFDAASVRNAKDRSIAVAEFFEADANTYKTDDKFDVIVFNETMYYMRDPIQLLRRYAGYLQPGGILIVSNFIARYLLRFPDEIARHFQVVEQTTVVNSQGLGWTIQVVCPQAEAAD
jgi:SAM-dependent methyltransferase